MSEHTFLFYDFETWGVNPQYDFACQFAAIRTDQDLEIIERPVSFYCQIPNDYLPHPKACLVTGITPQKTLSEGLIEADFSKKVYEQMIRPSTCSVGYNSINFDDEVARNLFYRNFYDAYEREYKHGNSRWDIIDLVRACYALRPEGLQWAYKPDGRPSFRLEDLTSANGVSHESAHDALSDVEATISIAKLIKTIHPKLFDYYFELRSKQNVQRLLRFDLNSPLLLVSGKINAQRACLSIILPICAHPSNPNACIYVDLNTDISSLEEHSSETLKKLIFKKDTIINDKEKLGVGLLHTNRAPFISTVKLLTDEICEKAKINRDYCRSNLVRLRERTEVKALLSDVFASRDSDSDTQLDIDATLYTGGFATQADKLIMSEITNANYDQLCVINEKLGDTKLAKQLFRYRARNFPTSLSSLELEKWQRHRLLRFSEQGKKTCLSAEEFSEQLMVLAQENANNPKGLSIVHALEKYLTSLY